MHQTKKVYIETYGCQMNVAQSAQLNKLLTKNYFLNSEHYNEADIIIVNACSVREHAEKKVFDRIQFFNSIKKKKDIKIMVIGCFAQNNQEKIKADYIIGTAQFNTIPKILSKNFHQRYMNVDLGEYEFLQPVKENKFFFKAMVDIMKGCDNYCSYCIVPYVRGKPMSRTSIEILDGIKRLSDKGVKEIFLLGQNVNSYGKDNQEIGFGELLSKINSIEGIERIRFMTSHPKDFSKEFIDSIFNNSKVCPAIHLPIQTGSDRILKLMNRGYTVAQYQEIVNTIKSFQKDYSLSTDFLVGFPGETDKDFLETVDIIKKIRFNEAYMFKYSSRPYIKAREMSDQVSEEVKSERLDYLIQEQRKIEGEIMRKNIGKTRIVLVESISKKDKKKFSGRDELNNVVILDEKVNIGEFYKIKIQGINGAALIGEIAV